jgi:hypothetical protein
MNIFFPFWPSMKKREAHSGKRMVPVLVAVLLTLGCTASREQRIEEIQSAHPQWEPAMVSEIAANRVVPGMTGDMVVAALRKPDSVSVDGNQEKWGYSIPREYNMGAIRQKFVYFVYFENGKVIRTEGDRKALGYRR